MQGFCGGPIKRVASLGFGPVKRRRIYLIFQSLGAYSGAEYCMLDLSLKEISEFSRNVLKIAVAWFYLRADHSR